MSSGVKELISAVAFIFLGLFIETQKEVSIACSLLMFISLSSAPPNPLFKLLIEKKTLAGGVLDEKSRLPAVAPFAVQSVFRTGLKSNPSLQKHRSRLSQDLSFPKAWTKETEPPRPPPPLLTIATHYSR